MGTKVQYKSYLPGYHPMGELNDDSNSRTWPVYYGDKPSSNGQFHDPYSQRTIADGYFGYHTEAVKQKMLEHEATFKRQVYELHRVYRVQRDLMDELKMNELQKQSMGIETSMSSCSASQRQDAQRWHASSAFPPSSSSSVKPAVLGAKDFHSTPSFLSGKNPQNGLVSPSNAGSSKDCDVEIIDCRPSKARSKFNLELRADEYIDVEEPKYSSKRPPCVSSYPSNGSCENPPSSSAKMLLGGAVQIDSRGIGARQNNGGLADLNEKIQIQQPNSSSLNFVGCDSSFRSNQQFGSKSQAQAFPQELMLNSHQGRDDSRPRNLNMGQKEKGNWSLMLESALSKGQTAAFPQNLLSDKISVFNKGQEASHFQASQIKTENWKERSEGGSKHSAAGIDFFNRLSGPRQLGTSISTSMSPWDKSGSCVSQKSAADVPHPCFNPAGTLPQSLRSSSKSAWTVGQGWQMNSDSGRDCAYQNGFYKGTCSGPGPTRCPTGGSDYLNRSNGSHVASGLSFSQNGSLSLKGATSVNASAAKGIDLNIVSVGDSHDSVEDTRFDRLNRDHRVADLPWLKSSTGLRNGMISGLDSSAYGMESKRPTAKKIMGVPIFGESPKGASSCRPSLSKEDEMGTARNVRDFDMNLPCESEDKDAKTAGVSRRNHIDLNTCLTEDDALVTISTPGCDSGKRVIRGFDLEAPGETEEEELVQRTPQEPEDSDEDLLTVAVEAIVGISSCRKLTLTENPARDPPEAVPDALKWFSDVISSCANDEDKKLLDEIGENNAEENDTEEDVESMDYFEYMTLQLPETKEEDYLPDYPKPPEPLGAGPFTARTRKGQARRGRPRRDFQRDILPGLTSLARHEVTEDLQTFGGLMRAMGHSWQSGLTRRAGPRRGRPRLTPVQPPNPSPATTPSPIRSPLLPRKPASEASPSPACSPSPQKRTKTTAGRELIHMEDNHRSLTGWGKTTRRPRRQRCPAIGNASFLHIA
uniref:Uncharacterized protein n=1 Tax=Kalanchoe fedtschenkoi TaxID=63787 RepID=A0A7N0UJM0_KALFE